MFNQQIITKRRKRALRPRASSEFMQFIWQDLLARLNTLKVSYQSILIVGNDEWDASNSDVFAGKELFFCREDQEISKPYDLIIFPFGLYSINDVPRFLSHVFNHLTQEGIFIASFPGHRSLHNLRKYLLNAEQQYKLPHASHIAPFIHFDHCQPLIKQAGFPETIIDLEKIHLEYQNICAFIRAIKNIGESCALEVNNPPILPRCLYQHILNDDETFVDSIDLVSIIAAKNKQNIVVKRDNVEANHA